MKFFDRGNKTLAVWLPIVGGPGLALLVFIFSYWIDPLNLKGEKGAAAFFFSVLILMVGQWLVTVIEIQKTALYSDRLYGAIKNYLHVTPVGSPEEALRYVYNRLSALREVQNTRLNTAEELERAGERLYENTVFKDLISEIPTHCCKKLIWKDIGDSYALPKLREIYANCLKFGDGKYSSKYKFKLLDNISPQINFILLEYHDGSKEVLFNWDFRGTGQDPIVLISRDHQIIEMFTIQFTMLWRKCSEDHDSQATMSTSMK